MAFPIKYENIWINVNSIETFFREDRCVWVNFISGNSEHYDFDNEQLAKDFEKVILMSMRESKV